MGFTKFCAALLNHPDTEMQAIPQTILDQVLMLAFHSSPASVSSSPGEVLQAGGCGLHQASFTSLDGLCFSGVRSTEWTPEQLNNAPCCRLPHALPLHCQWGKPSPGTSTSDPLHPDTAGTGHHGPATGLGPNP